MQSWQKTCPQGVVVILVMSSRHTEHLCDFLFGEGEGGCRLASAGAELSGDWFWKDNKS